VKIAILTAFHGRPEISAIYKQYLRYFAAGSAQMGITIESFSAITTGEIQPFIPDVICQNLPVSEKHNKIGAFICDYAESMGDFDYVMQLGSDDIVSDDIWSLYSAGFGKPIIGLSDMVFYDIDSGRCKLIHKTQLGNAFGAGRMIRFDIFKSFGGQLWPKNRNSGLDWYSFEKMNQPEWRVSQRKNPVLVDLKSKENIWKFYSLKGTEIEVPKWVKPII
jgi:hypothetical protein